jgi:hypothetical protein
MTPSQETCPEPFPHEERAMDRQLGAVGARPIGPNSPELAPRKLQRGIARHLGAGCGIAVLAALAGTAGAASGILPGAGLCVAAAQAGHVSLVVEHGDGRTVSRCVSFSGRSVTGEQILQASGLEYATQSYGSLGDAVCEVDHEPAAYTSCLPSSGNYWVLFVSRSGGAWQEAAKGISQTTFSSGDAAGLRYDPETGADPPPTGSPTAACVAAAQAGTAAASTSASSSGISPGLIAALAVAAALVLLAAFQLVIRRRRT